MPGFLSTLSIPFLLAFSIPLSLFAVVTTTAAFWILLLRVSMVYAELLAALLHAYIVPSAKNSNSKSPPPPATAPKTPVEHLSPQTRRASRSSSGSDGLQMQPFRPSQSAVTLPERSMPRDYEGVGGWREQEDNEDDEATWLEFNSRLELPTYSLQRRNLSQTSLHFPGSGYVSPEAVRTPLRIRTPAARRRVGSGAESPEGYFNMPLTMTTNSERGSRVSFEADGPRTSASAATLRSGKHTRQSTT